MARPKEALDSSLAVQQAVRSAFREGKIRGSGLTYRTVGLAVTEEYPQPREEKWMRDVLSRPLTPSVLREVFFRYRKLGIRLRRSRFIKFERAMSSNARPSFALLPGHAARLVELITRDLSEVGLLKKNSQSRLEGVIYRFIVPYEQVLRSDVGVAVMRTWKTLLEKSLAQNEELDTAKQALTRTLAREQTDGSDLLVVVLPGHAFRLGSSLARLIVPDPRDIKRARLIVGRVTETIAPYETAYHSEVGQALLSAWGSSLETPFDGQTACIGGQAIRFNPLTVAIVNARVSKRRQRNAMLVDYATPFIASI